MRISDWSSYLCSSDLFNWAVGAGDEPGGQPQTGCEGLVIQIGEQQRTPDLLPVVEIDAGRQFAAEPGMNQRPLHRCTVLALPALFECIEQWMKSSEQRRVGKRGGSQGRDGGEP